MTSNGLLIVPYRLGILQIFIVYPPFFQALDGIPLALRSPVGQGTGVYPFGLALGEVRGMNRLKLALELFFQRQVEEGEVGSAAYDRMTREIKGSIYSLFALFELVALTSYIPIDSFNIFQGRLDHMNNMGGIVGAIVSEWFLGTVGIAGYAVIALTLWLAISAFRGISIRKNLFPMLGLILGTILTAITCQLCLSDKFPEASLLQGGVVGRYVGIALRTYFNTTGALLMVAGGYVLTLILTLGFSFTHAASALFGKEEEEEKEITQKIQVPAKKKAAAPAPMPTKKSRSRKKKTEEGGDGNSDDEVTEELDLNASEEEEEGGEQTVATIDPNEFIELIPYEGGYSLPSARLLKGDNGGAKKMSRGEMRDNSRKLIEHLLSFQITGEVTSVSVGPVLITYEFKPSAGIKLSKIAALQDDLGVVLGTRELRIIAPIPGKTVVGIEVPRPQIETIPLKDLISEKEFFDKKIKIPVSLGKTTDGQPVFGDLAAMPHLLVAGATGSGKSVFVNSLIMSFLYRLSPQELRLILVDPKMLELNAFDGIPHLITNVITNNSVAYNALNWAVQEMERRYNLMADTNSKNIDSYNSKLRGNNKLPFIVIVVDELADLMMSGGEAVEVAITRLAQKARAAGIHLVLATQRPSTDVVTGLIKANIPSRLSFKVPSGIDSRTVLDTGGAEKLIGRGDSLMIQPAAPLRRLHGCFVTEEELGRVVKYVKAGKDHSKNYIQFSSAKPEE